ncbi:SidA/IucD/PvdA family monooxygenase [Bacillus mangrovi]|uniref:SidA/IucD/PvdA family monooxygenase n=1 Tax=Metabacillus mangrovi TaxID=1491830 RepID=A0A7X2S6A2_9BACI|nr:FAD/NAD(P)-binding protein [Metabacillus mangrovi]MTH54439.1 SidA/IucD/PvdA family monooxygenase [Metabacillus mangrovi]
MFKWLIIGGGIQGIAAASFLRESSKIKAEDICILDPHDEPLRHWDRCTSLISMPYLRSPSVHHLERDPFALQKHERKRPDPRSFYGRYKRPSLDLFNTHSADLISKLAIRKSWVQDRAQSILRSGSCWKVSGESGNLYSAEHVILAIGIGEQPALPEWAEKLARDCSEPVYHIFDQHLPPLETLEGPIVVAGGGITAAHLLIKLSDLYPGNVKQVIRHPHRIHDFDSDPAWIGQKNQGPFRKVSSYAERRKMIREARHRGSMPRELSLKLKKLVHDGKIESVTGNITSIEKQQTSLSILLKEWPEPLNAGTVLLATGFENKLPGAELLAPLIEQEDLLCSECGYPIVSPSLEWKSGLYVMGALAELEMGPIARNIAGARQAAEKIADTI